MSEQRYLPLGQIRADPTPITQTDFGYTGQRALPDTGLMDYKARFYSPSLGRFLSADTIVPSYANPQLAPLMPKPKKDDALSHSGSGTGGSEGWKWNGEQRMSGRR
ncbi:MAG TPA: RHS repeat-associated core domain-containing protein [Anaerolineales bacterium]|nr:RHS repeat-associated core domain-containing protein [Anaerolineales bacterium]